MKRRRDESSPSETLARGLGWFSIGLGLAELAAPRTVARAAGLRDETRTDATIRAFGAREVGNGLAILLQPERAAWLWTRVGGDLVDVSFLASAPRGESARVGVATAAVLGVTALDVFCATQLGRRPAGMARRRSSDVRVRKVTTVNRSIDEVYQFWRDFEGFPRFMRHLESVTRIDERRSRWRAKAPAGMTVEWEAEIIEDREPDRIAWRSVEGSDVQHSGSVSFRRAPGARGTEVDVRLTYSPPAGSLGRGVAWLLGEEPAQQIEEDLHRFKQLLETGEIPLSDGPGVWRAAQPPAQPDALRKMAGVTL